MITFEDACAAVDRIRHPFMIFILRRSEFDPTNQVELVITHKTVDSDTMQPITLRRLTRMSFVYCYDQQQVIEEVWRAVKNAMVHEAGEFFKVDGVAVHHPHRSSYDAPKMEQPVTSSHRSVGGPFAA